MTTKEPYSYVVLRYVHDVLTGEFVNVGVVMVVPGQARFFAKTRKTFGRIKSVFPDLESYSYKRAMEAIDRGIRGVERRMKSEGLFKGEKTAADYARLALPSDDSSLQWSQVGAGLTADAQKTFDHLYQRFVAQYDTASPKRRSDDDVWRPVHARLKEQGINVSLEPKKVAGRTDSIEFRHAWKNSRWHVYEPLSFDLADSDNIKDKARRWLGHLSAVADGASDKVQLHFIVGKPQIRSLEPAYQTAIEILRRGPFEPQVFEEDRVEEIVQQIEDEVRHHEGPAT